LLRGIVFWVVCAGILAVVSPHSTAQERHPPGTGGGGRPARLAEPTVAQLKSALHAQDSDGGILIVLPADLLFGATAEELSGNALPTLEKVAALIAQTRPKEVWVTGHTDGNGGDAENQKLSEVRAHAVAMWLAGRPARTQAIIVEKGYGRTRPVAPNHNADGSDNPEGRAQNRRIEITLRR
jgi:outer membrane protein OmpA-like peptidoglycan-associated protein